MGLDRHPQCRWTALESDWDYSRPRRAVHFDGHLKRRSVKQDPAACGEFRGRAIVIFKKDVDGLTTLRHHVAWVDFEVNFTGAPLSGVSTTRLVRLPHPR